MHKAFFLDRDGTINIDTDYVHRIDEWQWCTGAIDAIRWMNQHDYKVIVVTNQSGISRGKYSLEQVNHLHEWVDEQLSKHHAKVDAWYVAPFHPNFNQGGPWPQEDRKPNTGMFEKAIERFHIDPASSIMIGDKVSDLQPALQLGMQAFMIKTWHYPKQSKQWLEQHRISPFPHIAAAMNHITQDFKTPFIYEQID